MFTVTLTDAEIVTCRLLGGMRSLTARKYSVLDRKMADLQGIDIDQDGMMAEFAFCKKMNLFCDIVPSPRSGSADAIFQGKRIDVKSTRHAQGRLLSTSKENNDIDIYVLAIIAGDQVKFPGFATRDELINQGTKIDLGYGTGYGLEQHQLRTWKLEYWDKKG